MLTSSAFVLLLLLLFILLLILLFCLLLFSSTNSSPTRPPPPATAAPVDYVLVCIRLCTLAALFCLLAICLTSYRYHGTGDHDHRRHASVWTTTLTAEKWLGRADTLLTLSINLSQLVMFHSGPRLVCVLVLDLLHDMLRLRLRTVSSKLGFLYVLLFCTNAAAMHFACHNHDSSSSRTASSGSNSRTSYNSTCTSSSSFTNSSSSSSSHFPTILTSSPVDLLHAVLFASSPSLVDLPRVIMACVWYTSTVPRLILFLMPFALAVPMSTLGPPLVAGYAVYVQAREGYLYDPWLFRAWRPLFVGVHPLAKLVLCSAAAAMLAHAVVMCNHNVRRYGLRLKMVSAAVVTAVGWILGMMCFVLCPRRVNEKAGSFGVQEGRRKK